ncbi:MAG: hypothetical protein HRU21_04390 [Pseudomonadales bacterium]|nr:hypothetical protein [Pseudomonadales bacterium]
MDINQQQQLHATISDLRLKLNQAVGPIAVELGYQGEQIAQLMNKVQPAFFQAWFAGTQADVALTQAIQQGDTELCCEMLEHELERGASAEQAFASIKRLKQAAGASDQQNAIAEATFLKQLSLGDNPSESLQAAFKALQ